MFTLRIENSKGQIIQLTQNESSYQVVNVEGLNPPKSNIYTNPVANMDGAKFKSSKIDMRNIVITVKISGEVEKNRLNLYRYINTKKWCKIYYTNGSREVYAEGYCETIETDLFSMKQEVQISILCPDPYLRSIETIYYDLSKVYGAFRFPFAIDSVGIEFSVLDMGRVTTVFNEGELETGMIITLTALADNVQGIEISNADTSDYMYLDVTMNEGDVIKINTNKGQKSIIMISDGVETNIINKLGGSSTWLQLESGFNNFTYSTDSSDQFLKVEFDYNHQYEGV